MNMAGSRKRIAAAILMVVTAASVASAEPIDPETLSAGFVTCIPNAGSGCISSNLLATTAQWRVVNLLSADLSSVTQTTDFLNVSLGFSYEGGSLLWTWSSVSPAFVETDPFDFSLIKTISSLTFQGTLARTALDLLSGDTFIADSTLLTAAATTFPPPLGISIEGTRVHPVPEPTSIALLATGFLTLLRRRSTS